MNGNENKTQVIDKHHAFLLHKATELYNVPYDVLFGIYDIAFNTGYVAGMKRR